ncbi:MAG: DUF1232 domain-containing protein [Chloroflexi bacterium]|nr:DUF1232 domain-containing protein [Chloroflexota bacterium]
MQVRPGLRLGLAVFSLWPFMPIVARAPLYGRLIVELMLDRRVPASRKALLGLALAYVASPIDLVPDFIPVISRLDDVAALVISLDLLLEGVPREVLIEKMYQLGIDGRELERDMASVRRFLPAPIRSAALRLPIAIDRASAVVRSWIDEQRSTTRPKEEPHA